MAETDSMNAQSSEEEPNATILIVDDDDAIRALLAQSLGARGYRTRTARNAREMDNLLALNPVDVVILDIMMPGEDGLSACRRLAARAGPPVILLSARGSEEDRITGLEIGAIHYLPKPCSAREVLANVRTVLRHHRKSEIARKVVSFRGWRVDLAANEIFDPDGVLVLLTDGEFAVLRVFIERPRRVLSRDELLLAARGPDSESFDRAIDIQVSRLRRKLRAPGDTVFRTVRNEGYMLASQVVIKSS